MITKYTNYEKRRRTENYQFENQIKSQREREANAIRTNATNSKIILLKLRHRSPSRLFSATGVLVVELK